MKASGRLSGASASEVADTKLTDAAGSKTEPAASISMRSTFGEVGDRVGPVSGDPNTNVFVTEAAG